MEKDYSQDEEFNEDDDVNIIPASGTPDPVRVAKQKRLLLKSREMEVPDQGKQLLSDDLGFDAEPTTASSSATSASATTVDLGLVKLEKTDEEESWKSDVILVVDEEEIPIAVRKKLS